MDSDLVFSTGAERKYSGRVTGEGIYMRRIEIHTETVQTGSGHSSKGRQQKWFQNGRW